MTGTRTQDRARLDSSSPIDVLKLAQIQQRGTTELGTALSELIPSITFPRSVYVGGTSAVRPASLRGLSPDQTLVLINGERGHSSALLNINSSVGRGSAAVDLNTIPSVALDRIEVLRDGASAQYGSDAIAGVINLRLRGIDHGGGASVTFGGYDTDVNVALAPRHVQDGGTLTTSAWQGFKLGDGGFVTVSGEYVLRNATNRADADRRLITPSVVSQFGDPKSTQLSGWINAKLPLGDTWSLYGWGGYQHRNTDATDVFRPTASTTIIPQFGDINAVTAVHPNGYYPVTRYASKDLNSALGLRGEIGDWKADFNVSYGRNRIDITSTSVNSTYGAATPTRFYDGALIYDQWLGTAQLSRRYALGSANTLNVAAGAEYRREGFQIVAGQHESYDRGPLGSNATLASGNSGFVGFQPANQVDAHRDNMSAYLDLEARLGDRLTLGAAGRFEHYSDTGNNGTGKASARYDFNQAFALRATASTGFRAPSLQQQYFTSTQSVEQIVNGQPVLLQTGTYPATSAIAEALGGKPLRPEKSFNASVGGVLRSGRFSATVDGYRIRIRDQLALSENILSPVLAPLGVGAARFFINGITSTTYGIDVVTNYKIPAGAIGSFNLSLAYNHNDVTLSKTPAATLFGAVRRTALVDGTPEDKVIGGVDWSLGGVGATSQVIYYGSTAQAQAVGITNYSGNRVITNLEVHFQSAGFTFAVGADNLFDVYPKRAPVLPTGAYDGLGTLPYPFFSPFGFNGRRLYVRAGVQW